MRLRGAFSGQVLPLVAACIVVLLGFTALAVDLGMAWTIKRHMQTAADAAAVAAATALYNGGTYTSATTAAQDSATLNGFTNGSDNVTVTAAEPTTSPYNTISYVQVNVAQSVPTYFLRALGYSALNIGAQAIAGTESGGACVYALDPSRASAIGVTGNFSVNASCGVLDDSSSASAFTATGNGNFTATSIGVVGSSPGYSDTGNVTLSPTPVTNIVPGGDPLSYIAAPSVGSCTQAATTNSGSYSPSGNFTTLNVSPAVYSGGMSISGNITTLNFAAGTYGNGVSVGGNVGTANFSPGQYQDGSGSGASITMSGNTTMSFASGSYTFCGPLSIVGNNTVTLQPGLYVGGISITGNANVTFSSGTYVLAGGGLTVTGNSTLTGTGVTFYNTSSSGFGYGPIDLTGNETANLGAPTSGALAGMLFFQDRSVAYSGSNGSTVIGNSSSTFDGAVYFATTALSYYGNSSSSGYTFLVADMITITGNSSMTIGSDYSSLSNGSPIKSSTLYE